MFKVKRYQKLNEFDSLNDIGKNFIKRTTPPNEYSQAKKYEEKSMRPNKQNEKIFSLFQVINEKENEMSVTPTRMRQNTFASNDITKQNILPFYVTAMNIVIVWS